MKRKEIEQINMGLRMQKFLRNPSKHKNIQFFYYN